MIHNPAEHRFKDAGSPSDTVQEIKQYQGYKNRHFSSVYSCSSSQENRPAQNKSARDPKDERCPANRGYNRAARHKNERYQRITSEKYDVGIIK
jgi:hypothetical protein